MLLVNQFAVSFSNNQPIVGYLFFPCHTFLFDAHIKTSRKTCAHDERAYLLFSHPLYTPLIPSDSGVHLEHIPNSASLSPLFPLHVPHHLHPLHQGGFSSVMGIHLSCSWHGMRSAPSQISRNTVLL